MALPIHIAFCVNDSYVPYITVAIKSIAENHKDEDLTIHVLSDFISPKHRWRLDCVAKPYHNVKLSVCIVDDSSLRGLKDTWTIYTWYRVLLPEVLGEDVHRVLYLDADVIVSGNLGELFQLDMTDKAIAGTIDFQSKDRATFQRCGFEQEKGYVCAGVMLMNLDYWRRNGIADKVVRWGRDNNDRIRFPDQDSINYICQDAKILLPLKYDVIDGFFYDDYYYQHYPQELRECVEAPVIIHYAGQPPWIVEMSNNLLQDEWDRYNHLLKRPIRKSYQSKKTQKLKVIIYRLLHTEGKRRLTRHDVLEKLNNDS